jgi:glycosyltransferase involved in cell wall biosynthesis
MTTVPAHARPRTLIVLRHLPSPARDGNDLRHLSLVEALADRGPTFVFGLRGAGSAPRGDLAGWRAASDPDAANTPEGLEALRTQHSPFATVHSSSTVAELAGVITEFAPDVVVVGGLELSGYLGALRPLTPRLVLDLDWAQAFGFDEMAHADPNRQRRLVWRRAASLVAKEEREAFEIVDQVWVSSPEELERVRVGVDAQTETAVVPNVIDVDSYSRAARCERGALVYTARFSFWPNEEAARILVREILPHLPDASLALVGIAPPAWLLELDDPRVDVTGPVPDVRPHLAAASVMPVPLVAGVGVRFKVLEAFASGLPVVSTRKGVEGLGLVEQEHYLRAEQPHEFVRAIARLDDDPALAIELVERTAELVADHFSLDAVRRALDLALG